MQNKKNIAFSLLIFLNFFFYAQTPFETEFSNENSGKIISINTENLVEIPRLSSYETLFKEYSKIIESNYKAISAGHTPEYLFFRYKNTENFTLQGLSSRCNINYDTIATLNKIESSENSIKNKELILPTVQGLFINQNPGKNSIEILLQENHTLQNNHKKILYFIINGENYIFIPGVRLSSTERAYFLDSSLSLPLKPDSFWVSSEFGKRKNPFSGEIKNHNGIDLAAEEGTPVYAIKDGAVAFSIDNDAEFGNYIILQHDTGKTTSVYAHLSKIMVTQYQTVKKGDVIGLVGSSGKVTGPHLHFEIRTGGKAENPRSKLNLN